ncbi:MAG: YiiG family protein [Lachnospiraceae bacterium]|nr:YiiG family protein [Lachnospiraceae bacterium]
MKKKHHMKAGYFAVNVLCLSLLLGGCTGKQHNDTAKDTVNQADTDNAVRTATNQASEDTSEPKSTAESESESEYDLEEMQFIKYNIYVEMNNYMVEMLDILDDYYSVVEYADEFAFVADSEYTYKYGIHSLNSSIVDDAVSVAAMDPSFDKLDELTLQIADPMRNLMDIFSDIDHSYDFADNQYAKAKEFHTVIQANAETFGELSYEFMDEVSIMCAEQIVIDEQRMLDEGMLITYNCSHMISVTQALLNECYAQDVYDDNITELDLTNIRPLYDELAATVAAYEEAVSDKNQLMKESLSNSTPFSGLPNSLLQSVEWMIKQVESQKPIEDPGREYLGGIIHIEEVLSSVIDRYNSVFTE